MTMNAHYAHGLPVQACQNNPSSARNVGSQDHVLGDTNALPAIIPRTFSETLPTATSSHMYAQRLLRGFPTNHPDLVGFQQCNLQSIGRLLWLSLDMVIACDLSWDDCGGARTHGCIADHQRITKPDQDIKSETSLRNALQPNFPQQTGCTNS